MKKLQLRLLRKSLRLTQGQLAERLNVHQSAISRWETGLTSPDPETRRKLLDLAQVSTSNDVQRLIRMVSRARAPMLLADSDWTVIAASEGAATLHGIPANECIGLNYEARMDPVTRRHWDLARDAGFLLKDTVAVRFHGALAVLSGEIVPLTGSWHSFTDPMDGDIYILAEAMPINPRPDNLDATWEVLSQEDLLVG